MWPKARKGARTAHIHVKVIQNDDEKIDFFFERIKTKFKIQINANNSFEMKMQKKTDFSENFVEE